MTLKHVARYCALAVVSVSLAVTSGCGAAQQLQTGVIKQSTITTDTSTKQQSQPVPSTTKHDTSKKPESTSLTMNKSELLRLSGKLVNMPLDPTTLEQSDLSKLVFTNATRDLYRKNNDELITMLMSDGSAPIVQTGEQSATVTYKGTILDNQPYIGSDKYPQQFDNTIQYYNRMYPRSELARKPDTRITIRFTQQNNTISVDVHTEGVH